MGIPLEQAPAVTIPPKLLLFDLDGTVVRADHSVDPRVSEALRRLSQNGVAIGIASGRAAFGARHLYEPLAVNAPSMFFSGSLVEDPKTQKALFLEPLESQTLLELAKQAKQIGLYAELYSSDEYLIEAPGRLTDLHTEYLGKPPIVGSFEEWSAKQSILKLVLIADTPNDAIALRALARDYDNLSCGLAFGAAHPELLFANFTSPRAQRLLALKTILEHLGLTSAQVACFGDAESDLPFLTNCGFGFALANAPQAVRAQAQYITASIDRDGVLPALKYLFPNTL